MVPDDLPAIADLIPHRGSSILLDRVVHHDPDETRAIVIIRNQRWLTRADGSTASWLAVEYMAQCAGVHESLLARDRRVAELGFVASVKSLRLDVAHFGTDEILEVRTRRCRGRPELGVVSHSCSIRRTDSEDTSPSAHGRLVLVIARLGTPPLA
jgi:predicted hotdog family 3-hydroxylacyl-ACP dehydratase